MICDRQQPVSTKNLVTLFRVGGQGLWPRAALMIALGLGGAAMGGCGDSSTETLEVETPTGDLEVRDGEDPQAVNLDPGADLSEGESPN